MGTDNAMDMDTGISTLLITYIRVTLIINMITIEAKGMIPGQIITMETTIEKEGAHTMKRSKTLAEDGATVMVATKEGQKRTDAAIIVVHW